MAFHARGAIQPRRPRFAGSRSGPTQAPARSQSPSSVSPPYPPEPASSGPVRPAQGTTNARSEPSRRNRSRSPGAVRGSSASGCHQPFRHQAMEPAQVVLELPFERSEPPLAPLAMVVGGDPLIDAGTEPRRGPEQQRPAGGCERRASGELRLEGTERCQQLLPRVGVEATGLEQVLPVGDGAQVRAGARVEHAQRVQLPRRQQPAIRALAEALVRLQQAVQVGRELRPFEQVDQPLPLANEIDRRHSLGQKVGQLAGRGQLRQARAAGRGAGSGDRDRPRRDVGASLQYLPGRAGGSGERRLRNADGERDRLRKREGHRRSDTGLIAGRRTIAAAGQADAGSSHQQRRQHHSSSEVRFAHSASEVRFAHSRRIRCSIQMRISSTPMWADAAAIVSSSRASVSADSRKPLASRNSSAAATATLLLPSTKA